MEHMNFDCMVYFLKTQLLEASGGAGQGLDRETLLWEFFEGQVVQEATLSAQEFEGILTAAVKSQPIHKVSYQVKTYATMLTGYYL